MNRANASSQKRFVAFFTLHGTDHWGGTGTDCSVILSMHAMQRHMSFGRAVFGANAAFEMHCHLQQASIYSRLLSQCLHANEHRGEMSHDSQSYAHADRQEGRERRDGKRRETSEREKERRRGAAREEEEYNTGWWSQTETASKRARVTFPLPVGAEYTVCVRGYWSHSGHLKRWGFQEHENKENARLVAKIKTKDKDVGQRSTWGRHEVRVRRGVRRRKSRTARLQMTCPEKHRKRDRFTGNEKTGLPKGHSVHQH